MLRIHERRYYVYPSMLEAMPIKIASPEDFVNNVDDVTEIYLLRPDDDES